MRRLNQKGQLKISFGTIFSIILIVIFISFAFYTIQKFLGVKNSIQLGKFSEDFQEDVNRVWNSAQGSEKKSYFIPNGVRLVCFADYLSNERGENSNLYDEFILSFYNEENLFFYPRESAEGFDSIEIRNLNLDKITEINNPYCIENKNGVVILTIKKDFNENLVTITE
ncbi:MAG: hypothetical protein WDZ77_00315 [Candidatus Pacearchaeota archaeon]